jgi:hypothetical protein
MYSGQYNAINPTGVKAPGTFTFTNQPIYRVDVNSTNYFKSPPKVVLSLMGYNQLAPVNSSTFMGFDVNITAIRTTAFDVKHNIFGANLTYLHYMYMAYITTDYNSEYYMQSFDTTASNKSYSMNIAFPGT